MRLEINLAWFFVVPGGKSFGATFVILGFNIYSAARCFI